MKFNWKPLAALSVALALVAPILVGCSGTPAGDSKAGVEKGDIVVDAHKGNASAPAGGSTGRRAATGGADGGQ